MAVLLMSALNPYAVTPEPRTDSKPFRRRFVRKTGFGSCRRKFLQNYFRQSFESSPESRGSQTSGVLPVLFVQAKRIKPFPLPGTSRFSKPRISPPEQQLPTNKIKTFPKRRFEVLQTSNQPTKQKLRTNPIKSFAASRQLLLFVKHKK